MRDPSSVPANIVLCKDHCSFNISEGEIPTAAAAGIKEIKIDAEIHAKEISTARGVDQEIRPIDPAHISDTYAA